MIQINFICVFEFTEDERQLGETVPNFKNTLSLLVI